MARRELMTGSSAGGLDDRTRALAGIAAALALGSQPGTIQSLTARATAANATKEQIIGVLLAVGPVIGTAHVVAMTPRLALSIGYDIDAALESTEDVSDPERR